VGTGRTAFGSSVATVAVAWYASIVVGFGPYGDVWGNELEPTGPAMPLLALLTVTDVDALDPGATASGMGRKPTSGACLPLMP